MKGSSWFLVFVLCVVAGLLWSHSPGLAFLAFLGGLDGYASRCRDERVLARMDAWEKEKEALYGSYNNPR